MVCKVSNLLTNANLINFNLNSSYLCHDDIIFCMEMLIPSVGTGKALALHRCC
jgi:hypothetical protein